MEQIDFDLVKATAITTYRCHRGCLLGFVSDVPGLGRLYSSRVKGEWSGAMDPSGENELYTSCRHLGGRLRFSHKPEGRVFLTQDDVRTTEPTIDRK